MPKKNKNEEKTVLRIRRQKDEDQQWKCAPKEENSNKLLSGSEMLFNESNKEFMDRISSCAELGEAKKTSFSDYRRKLGIRDSSESTPNSPSLSKIETSNSELSSEGKVDQGRTPSHRFGVPSSILSIDTDNTSTDNDSTKCTLSSSGKSGNNGLSMTAKVQDFYGDSKKGMACHHRKNLNESKDSYSPADEKMKVKYNQTDSKSVSDDIFVPSSEALINNSSTPNDYNVRVGIIETNIANLEDTTLASELVEENTEKLQEKRDVVVGKTKALTSGKTKKPTGNKSEKKVCGPKSRTRKKSSTEIDLLREELERTRKEVEELRMRQDRMFREKIEAEQQKFESHEKSDTRNHSDLTQISNSVKNDETLTEKEPILNSGTERANTAVNNVPEEPEYSVKSSESEHIADQKTLKPDDQSSNEMKPSENISMATEHAVEATVSNELTQDESSNKQTDAFKDFTHSASITRSDDCNADISSNSYASLSKHSEHFNLRFHYSHSDDQNNSEQMDLKNAMKHAIVDEIKSDHPEVPKPHVKKTQTDVEKLLRLNPDLEILRVHDTGVEGQSPFDGSRDELYECASITLVDPRLSDSRVPPKKRTKMMWDGVIVPVSSGSSSPVVETVIKSGSLTFNENMPQTLSSYNEASKVNEGSVDFFPISSHQSTNSRGNNALIPISSAPSSFPERQIYEHCNRTDSKDNLFSPAYGKSQPDEPNRENRQNPLDHNTEAAGVNRQNQYRQMEPNQHSQSMSVNLEDEYMQKSRQTSLQITYHQPSRQSIKPKGKTDHVPVLPGVSSALSQCQPICPDVRRPATSTGRKKSVDYSKSDQRPASEPKSSSAPSPSGFPRPSQGPSSDPYSFHSTFKPNEDQRSVDLDVNRSLMQDRRYASAFNRPLDSSSRQGVVFAQPENANSSNVGYHHNSISSKISARDSSVDIVSVNLPSRKRKPTEGDTNLSSQEYKQIHNSYAKSSATNIEKSSRQPKSNETVAQSENSCIPSGGSINDEKSLPILPVPSRPSLPFDEQRSYPPLPTKPIVLRHPLPVQPKAVHPLRTNQNPFHSNSHFVPNTIGNVANLGPSYPGATFNHLRKSPSAGFSPHEFTLPTSVGTLAGSSTNQLNHSYTASSFVPQQSAAATRSLRSTQAESSSKPQTYPNSISHPHSATLAQLAQEQELSALYHQRMSTSRYQVPDFQQQPQQQQSSEEFANKMNAVPQQNDWRMPSTCYVDPNLQNQHYQRQTQKPNNCLNMPNGTQNQATAKPQTYATSNQQLENQYMQDFLNKQKQFDSDKAKYEQFRIYQALQQQNNTESINRQNAMFSSQSEKQYHEQQRMGFQAPSVAYKSDAPPVSGNPSSDSQSMPLNLQKHKPDRERRNSATFVNANHHYSANVSNASQTVGASPSVSYQQSYSRPSQTHPSGFKAFQAAKTTTAQASPNMSIVSPSSSVSSGRSSDSGVSSVSSGENETTTTLTNIRNVNDASARNRAREVTQRTLPSPIMCCVCGKPATIRCPQCKKTEYCNEPCRFSHWVLHSKDCLKMGGTAITMHRKNKDVTYY